MRPDSPLKFESTLADVVQEIAPSLLAELIAWKCCRRCGGICHWATSDFSGAAGSLVCPHCRAFVVEWPCGVPIVCTCGCEVEGEYLVLDGLPVSTCCGAVLSPPAEYFPATGDEQLKVTSPQQHLRFASGGPGVEGAEPLLHREVPVDPLSN